MVFKIIIKDDAELELMEAIDYYNAINENLSKEFVKLFFDSLTSISQNPFLYQKVYKNIRQCVMLKFPYILYYTVNGQTEEVAIYAVYHTSRNPKIWKKRL